VVDYDADWIGANAIVLHVYQDIQHGGTCGFTTFALATSPPGAEVLHMPFGTPVQFAFASAKEVAERLGIEHLIVNDPRKLFIPEMRPS
jgi:hypothetical protein